MWLVEPSNWVKVRIPLVVADYGRAWAFGDGLFGHRLLLGRNRVGLHHGILLIIEVEQVRGYSQTDCVALATVMINFHPHDILLPVV